MAKKTLAAILQERTDTVEYRSIKQKLMKVAQNKGNEFRVIFIEQKTINQLQNEGISVTKVNEFGYDKYLLKW